jgi:hypothetical protein
MRTFGIVLGCLFTSAAVTFAAGEVPSQQPTAPPLAASAPERPMKVVVPDVRGQVYVFAKGILEDGGFAWKVEGRAQGYAASTVESQTPAPGTVLENTGAPTIVLRLATNPRYPEKGTPENRSPYPGTLVKSAKGQGRAAG